MFQISVYTDLTKNSSSITANELLFIGLSFVLIGVGHFIYRKYLSVVTTDTINELNSKSFTGLLGYQYTPMAAFIPIGFGLLLVFISLIING